MEINTVNDTIVNTWKDYIIEIEREKEQSVKKNVHTDNVDKVNYNYHSNNGKHSNYNPHSNGKTHSNYQGHDNSKPHSNNSGNHNNSSHENTTIPHEDRPNWHYNIAGHSRTPHNNYSYPHVDTPHPGGGHNNSVDHSDTIGSHSNGHTDTYHNNRAQKHKQSGYSQSLPHSDTQASHSNYHLDSRPHSNTDAYHSDQHSDSNPHNNYSYHSNTGFDHINYIPSIPYVYQERPFTNEPILTMSGTEDVIFYAYDKNNDNIGSQFNYSKEVLYKVEIRQIKDLLGNSKISSWKTLQDFNLTDRYRINTIDPFKTGNTDSIKTEGYYELKVTAKNNSYKDVDFVGIPLVKQIKILQNTRPTVVVNNPDEFLSFTFGFNGVVNKENKFIDYPDMIYSKNKESGFTGLFINISVKDEDIGDYLKGDVEIKSNNMVLASAPIIWENGNKLIRSDNKFVDGYIYISKQGLTEKYSETSFKNAVIEIKLNDYFDNDGCDPKGEFIISRKVNMTSGEDLFINIDKVAPKMSSVSGLNEIGKTATIKLSAIDDISGVRDITLPNGSVVKGSNCSYTVSKNGLYSFILTDNLGQSRFYVAEVIGIDGQKPIVNIINEKEWTNKDVNVTIKATD